MGVDQFPPAGGASFPAFPTSLDVFTRSSVTTGVGGPKDLTSVDPNLAASNLTVNLTINNTTLGGAAFMATVVSNDTRLVFERQEFGSSLWVPTAALDPSTGVWDWMHRVSDSGGAKSFIVPAQGALWLRIRRASGASLGAGTCTVHALASHTAFPSPPEYVGKRDLSLMVRGWPITAALLVIPYDIELENDDRTRTFTGAVGSSFVRAGRRWWLQGWDGAFLPNSGTDQCRVLLLSNRNGSVGSVGLAPSGSATVLKEWAFNSAPGRTGTWPRPRELQAYLGANTMSLGLAAQATAPGTGNKLTFSIDAFETL